MTHTCLCTRCDLFIFQKQPACYHLWMVVSAWFLTRLLPCQFVFFLRGGGDIWTFPCTGGWKRKMLDWENTQRQNSQIKTPDRSGGKSLKKKETSICSEEEDSGRGGMEQRVKICKKCVGTNKHGVATVTKSSRKIWTHPERQRERATTSAQPSCWEQSFSLFLTCVADVVI